MNIYSASLDMHKDNLEGFIVRVVMWLPSCVHGREKG